MNTINTSTYNNTIFEIYNLRNQIYREKEHNVMRTNKILLQDALGQPSAKAKKDRTFEDIFNLFIRSLRAQKRTESTIKNYKENINAFRLFFNGWDGTDIFFENMQNIDEENILFFIESMQKKGNSDSTINARLRHLKSVFNYALANRFITELPIRTFSVTTDKKNTIMEREKDIRLLQLSDMAKIIEIPKTDDVNIILDWITTATIAELGVRVATLWNIKREDINLANGTIFLRHQKRKNDENQVKFLSEQFIECLTFYFNLFDKHIGAMKEIYVQKLEAKAMKLKIPFEDYLKVQTDEIDKNMPGNYPLCMKNDGKRVALSTINERTKRYTSRVLGTKKANAHALRHSVGTCAAQQGASPFQIAELLGHKDIASTMHYLHFTAESKRQSDLAFCPTTLLSSNKIRS